MVARISRAGAVSTIRAPRGSAEPAAGRIGDGGQLHGRLDQHHAEHRRRWQQGDVSTRSAPRGDDQRRGRVTMARISSHAEHRRRWQRGRDQRGPSPRSAAPRGCSCMALMASSTRGDVSTDQQRRGLHDSARGRQEPPDGDGGRGWPDDQPRPAGAARERPAAPGAVSDDGQHAQGDGSSCMAAWISSTHRGGDQRRGDQLAGSGPDR